MPRQAEFALERSGDDGLIGLLLIIRRVQQTGGALGRATLVPFAELKLPRVAAGYEKLVSRMMDRQLAAGTAEEFKLTQTGHALVERTAEQYSLHAFFYDAYYEAVQHSRAHSLFCERVYGLDLCQHGMADMTQVELMLSSLQIAPGMALLDFGCGDGRISEYIAGAMHATVTGIDIAERAIELASERTQAKRTYLRFECFDVELSPARFAGGPFDRIVAIDSIFFARDQGTVLKWMIKHMKPGGKLALFYHAPPGTSAADTPLGKTLTTLGLFYSFHDLSKENAAHWKLKKQVLLELEPEFRAEDNLFLFKNRLAECDGLERNRRFLYIAE